MGCPEGKTVPEGEDGEAGAGEASGLRQIKHKVVLMP